MNESRVRFLERHLTQIGYDEAYRALELVKSEMCSKKGFSRHDGSHYYYHLVDTAQIILNFGIKDQTTITAAILHDYQEDVEGVTKLTISHLFGKEVAEIVDGLSKKKGINYKEDKNTEEYLYRMLDDWRKCVIKAADRIHNFGTLRHASPEKKLRQALQTEKIFIPFFKECRKRYPKYEHFFFSAKTIIEPHLWEIKEHYKEVEELKKKISQLENKILVP